MNHVADSSTGPEVLSQELVDNLVDFYTGFRPGTSGPRHFNHEDPGDASMSLLSFVENVIAKLERLLHFIPGSADRSLLERLHGITVGVARINASLTHRVPVLRSLFEDRVYLHFSDIFGLLSSV